MSGYCYRLYLIYIRYKIVSILVLMDVRLLQIGRYGEPIAYWSFNPCFNGCQATAWTSILLRLLMSSSFNPCFNGCQATASLYKKCSGIDIVSILVLMDVRLLQKNDRKSECKKYGFQSLF